MIIENFRSIIVLLLAILLSYFILIFNEKQTNKNHIKIFIVASIIPSIIIGLRDLSVGADTHNFSNHFLLYYKSGFTNNDKFSYLYYFFIFIVHLISNGELFFYFFFMSFISILVFLYTIKIVNKNNRTSYALLAYMLIIGFQLMNQSRQMMAYSFVMLGLAFLSKNDNKRFVLFNIVATSIHYSSFIGFFFYFLNFKDYKKTRKHIYIILIIMVMIFLPLLINIVKYILPSAYKGYIDIVDFKGIGWGFILDVIPAVATLLLLRSKHKNNIASNLFLNIIILSPLFRYLGYYSYYLMRLNYFSLMAIPIYIVIVLKDNDYKLSKLRMYSLNITFILYFIVKFLYLNDSSILPFVFR